MSDLTEALQGAGRQDDAKILVIDIERLPGTAEVFDSRVDWIRPDQWVEPPRTICWAARWHGTKRNIFEAEWIDPEAMVQHSWELYNEAQAVITYNGVKFDNAHLRTMWMEAGLPKPAPWKDIDLIKTARQFGYVSKSLDYVTKALGLGGKTDKYDVAVAKAAVAGDPKAQRRIRRYNIGDIDQTIALYQRWMGWIPNAPYLGPRLGAKVACNHCSSTDLRLQHGSYRAVGMDYELWRCFNCGAPVKGALLGRALTGGNAR